MEAYAAADLGGTGLRIRLLNQMRQVLLEKHFSNYPSPRGEDRVLFALERIREVAAESEYSRIRRIGLGLTGLFGHRVQIQSRHLDVCSTLKCEVLNVADDAVTSYLGTMGNKSGIVCAVGSGTVTLGVNSDGRALQVDGQGWFVGDLGSGAWIGRAGAARAVRAFQGMGAATLLTESATDYFGNLRSIALLIDQHPSPKALIANFAPYVVQAAGQGDKAAIGIVSQAGSFLAESIVHAYRALNTREVYTFAGSLISGPDHLLAKEVSANIAAAPGCSNLQWARPNGTSLDGAEDLACGDYGLLSGLVAAWAK